MIILFSIGKIFLILLFVFICILAAVLFAPVSYELDLDIDEKRVDVRINWLLKLVRFRFYMKERMEAVLSILFFKLDFTDPEAKKKRVARKAVRQSRKRKKQEKKKEKERRKQRKTYEKQKKARQAPGESRPEQEAVRPSPDKEQEAVPVKYDRDTGQADSEAAENADFSESSEESGGSRGMKESLKGLWDTVGKAFGYVGTFRKILNLVREYEVFSTVWPGLVRFLKRIRPRKMSGRIAFGLDDPAATGQITGAIAMIPLFYETDIRISPDFETEKAYVQGNIYIKGRMHLIHALIFIVGLIRSKKIRLFIGAVRNRK